MFLLVGLPIVHEARAAGARLAHAEGGGNNGGGADRSLRLDSSKADGR